jgi:hypothetical protein
MNFGTTEQAYSKAAYIGGNLAGEFGPADAPEVTTPLVRLSGAMEEARALAYRIQTLADRLCGPVPTPVNTSSGQSSPPAVFPAIRQSADQLSDAVREAHDAINRIERQLP